MRIRKHAKISPLAYASVLQTTTICQLNQSPWDVVTFSPDEYPPPTTTPPPPPPPLHHHQVDEENISPPNGSLCNSIGAPHSGNVAAAVATVGGFVDVEMEEVKPESSREELGKMVEVEDEDGDEELFCSKIDSKGWQCHRRVKSGYALCEHHLCRLNKYNQEHGVREYDDKPIEQRRRGRSKKASASTDSSGYYYYSGFGPRWGGKRRGGHNNYNGSSSIDQSSVNVSNFESSDNGRGETVSTSSRIGYGELDYIVEEGKEDGGGSGKKRARKPIKARSLKSLM